MRIFLAKNKKKKNTFQGVVDSDAFFYLHADFIYESAGGLLKQKEKEKKDGSSS